MLTSTSVASARNVGRMPRKERIEYPGAIYHIISRGNYRKPLFTLHGSGTAFEEALFEVADRCRWRIFAYVIMNNHYHVAVETPEANLVAGMKWLQGTFATRFNRLHQEQGHVFQGRYKSILVEEGRPLLGLINYIHLNPARAGLVSIDDLRRYPLSSYAHYWKRQRPACLDRAAVLALAGLPDSTEGMRSYEALLASVDEANPRKRADLHNLYTRGWFLGSKEAKRELITKLMKLHPKAAWSGRSRRELNEELWDQFVRDELRRAQKSEEDILRDPKGARWKVDIARSLRRQFTAGNRWIAQRLHMGHPTRVSLALRSP